MIITKSDKNKIRKWLTKKSKNRCIVDPSACPFVLKETAKKDTRHGCGICIEIFPRVKPHHSQMYRWEYIKGKKYYDNGLIVNSCPCFLYKHSYVVQRFKYVLENW